MSALADRLSREYGFSAAEAERYAAAIAQGAPDGAPEPPDAREAGRPEGLPAPPQAAMAPTQEGLFAREPAARSTEEAAPQPPAQAQALPEAQPAAAAFLPQPTAAEQLAALLRRTRRLCPDMERWGEELY